jgi:hypothetical protein
MPDLGWLELAVNVGTLAAQQAVCGLLDGGAALAWSRPPDSVPVVLFPLVPDRAHDHVVADDLEEDDVARASHALPRSQGRATVGLPISFLEPALDGWQLVSSASTSSSDPPPNMPACKRN